MYILKNDINYTLEIKKSKFICYLYYVENEDDIKKILNDLKEKHKDATHHCYAYILENKQKYSDDGEPGGTAGVPMLDILKLNNLTNTLAVVVRYFGGIKLGAGGLVRAYRNSVNDTIKQAEIIKYIKYTYLNIYFDYNNEKFINSIIDYDNIIEKTYNENIIYKIKIDINELDTLKEILNNKNIKIEELK